MKYSLTQLLLEDIAPRNSNNVAGDPSKEGSAGIGFLNTYNIVKFAAKKAKDKLAIVAMTELYRQCDGNAKKIINAARKDAEIRDNEISLILDDVTLEEQIVNDMTGSKLSEDEKKNLAYCLRYFEDPYARPQKLKISPSDGQSDDEFKAELRQGVKELKIGAAIKGIDNWENQLNASNAALSRVMSSDANKAALKAAEKLFGTQGESFQIDLTKDPEIEPMLKAAENATYEFRSALGETGHTIFLKPQLVIVPNTANGTMTYAQCGSRPGSMSEAKTSKRILQIVRTPARSPLDRTSNRRGGREPRASLPQQRSKSGDDENLNADQEVKAGPKVKDLEEALDQLERREPAIARIILDLYKKPGITPANIIAAFTPINLPWMKKSLNRLTYSFPNEKGLGSSTQISTQGSVPLERVAAGVVPMFAAGYRTSQVPINALELIESALNVTNAQAKDPLLLYSAIDRQRNLFAKSKDARLALLYTIGVAIEYGKTGSSIDSERVTLGSSGLGTFIDSAYGSVLGFHRANTLAGKSGIQVLPGEKPDDLSFISGIMRRARGLPRRGNRITTMGFDPYEPINAEVEKDAVTLMPSEEGAALAKNKVIAVEAIKKLLNALKSELPASLKRAARIIGSVKDRQAEGTSSVGSTLTMISFCNEVAEIAGSNMVAAEGPILMGYTSNAILMSDQVNGEIVWTRLCKLSGANVGDVTGGKISNVSNANKFDASLAYIKWNGVMTGGNKVKAMKGIRSLFMSDFVSPLARVILHAIEGYESKGLLTSENAQKLREQLTTANQKVWRDVKNLSVNAPASARGVGLQSGRLSTSNVKTPSVSTALGHMGDQYTHLNQNDPLKAPGTLDITLVAANDAPRVVSLSTLSIKSSPASAESSEPNDDSSTGNTPPPPPPPAPAPAPAPPPTPATAAPAITFSADDDVNIPAGDLKKIEVTVTFTAKLANGNDHKQEASGTMLGGVTQQAAKDQGWKNAKTTLQNWPTKGQTTTNILEAFAENFRDKLKSDPSLTRGARVESIDVRVSSNESVKTGDSGGGTTDDTEQPEYNFQDLENDS